MPSQPDLFDPPPPPVCCGSCVVYNAMAIGSTAFGTCARYGTRLFEAEPETPDCYFPREQLVAALYGRRGR